jgi:NDP-sugar pyrophosphorylase family protein
MINVVIPMAGEGSRFVKAGFTKPKPFIDVVGKTMIERVIENLYIPEAQYILIARKSHLEREPEVVKAIESNYPARFIPIEHLTEGTACTVLFARKYINNDIPLLIANSDQIIDVNINDFIVDCADRNLDGSILTFVDPELNPKWSFAKVDESELVIEVQEKKPISKFATVGIYFFSQGRFFVDAATDMIIQNDRVNNEFYTCPSYNYAIKNGAKIGIFNMNFEQMHGIGTPEDLEKYLSK